MFAPNRLLTAKEQWLFIGIITAIVIGSVTIFYRGRQADSENSFILESPIPSAHPAVPGVREPENTVASPPLVQSGNKPETEGEKEESPGETRSEPALIGVAIMGPVRRPGLYFLPAEHRISDLISRAGGITHEADLSEISLTARLIDETTLTIPEKIASNIDGRQLSACRDTAGYVVNPAPYLKRSPQSQPEAHTFQPLPIPAESTSPAASAPVSGVSTEGMINVNHATEQELQELPGIGPVLAASIIAERERQPFATVEDLDRVPGIGEKRLEAIRELVTVN